MINLRLSRLISSKIIASIESNLAFDLSQTGYKKRLELKPRNFTFLRDFNKIDEMKKSLETVYDFLDPCSDDA